MDIRQADSTGVSVRPATAADESAIVALDATITGTAKSAYWADILERYTGPGNGPDRCCLVATSTTGEIAGFIVGEIRAWEFGSPPCGWVIALSVAPDRRERGIGSLLLGELCAALKQGDVSTIRTMVLRDDKVNMSFFRGEGLAAGPYIELEKHLE
ncbi:MAG: GNAT family N-acetyltransferase [Gammaproteobacteria bacterium]|nr:GNAT family N-acetyltransferase [Gammaproteobacteria bacterium]